MSGTYLSTEQLRAENYITNEVESIVLHPVEGLFATMMNPGNDDDDDDSSPQRELIFTHAVKRLYLVLHNVTRYLYTQVSETALSNSLC